MFYIHLDKVYLEDNCFVNDLNFNRLNLRYMFGYTFVKLYLRCFAINQYILLTRKLGQVRVHITFTN